MATLRKEHNLTVCERCLMGIECHEGNQATITRYFDDDGVCEWCEEEGFDTLYELV